MASKTTKKSNPIEIKSKSKNKKTDNKKTNSKKNVSFEVDEENDDGGVTTSEPMNTKTPTELVTELDEKIAEAKAARLEAETDHYDYFANTFEVVDTILTQHDNRELVNHQLASYKQFVEKDIGDIIQQFNTRKLYFNYDANANKHKVELHIDFLCYNLGRPTIHENDGSFKVMRPDIAKLRNLTYSAPLTLNIKLTRIIRSSSNPQTVNGEIIETFDEEDVKEEIFNNINFGRIPIMVLGVNCVLNKKDGTTLEQNGECPFDMGGYFIIGGNEKVIISQERIAENESFVFNNQKKLKGKEIEIRCVSDQIISVVMANVIRYVYRDGSLEFDMTNFKNPVNVFLLMKALGVKTDKKLFEYVCWDLDDETGKFLESVLKVTFEKLKKICKNHNIDTNAPAEKFQEILLNYLKYKNINRDIKMSHADKLDYLKKVLEDEVLPHIGKSFEKKAKYIGYMCRKLIMVQHDYLPHDDRDAYDNKRVDAPGRLMATQFRQCFNKLVKDMVKSITREIKNNKSRRDIFDLITSNNIYKIIKPTIIDGGLKYALATGNWGMKTNGKGSVKAGTAQVLNRLSYQSFVSHLRRVNSPSDKTGSNGKIVKPRKLHGTSWGYLCPAETPEGQPVGLVKNLSLTSKITAHSNSLIIRNLLDTLDILPLETLSPKEIGENTLVFLNGDWLGVHKEPKQLVEFMRKERRKANINIFTGIYWNFEQRTVRIYTDAGRLVRPLYVVDAGNKLRIDNKFYKKLEETGFSFNFLISPKFYEKTKTTFLEGLKAEEINDDISKLYGSEGVIEYIDTNEVNNTYIAMTDVDLRIEHPPYINQYTHCELHPGTILGAVAGVIPFSDDNQSPRNCYQCAMGKQSIGLFARNYQKRMDTIAYVANNLEKALVKTRFAKYINYDDVPCGLNAMVAIGCYTGYNMEDSVLLNQAAVDRGLFRATFYRTYKDDEKKIQSSGREEKFAKPNIKYTKGTKPGNYNKLDERGFIKLNEYVTSDDIIIGKVLPMKNKFDENGHQLYKDCSTNLRSNETGHVDKIYTDRNADGFRFVKIRMRTERIPVIGDKFASRCAQKGTVGMIFPQEQMPFNAEGLSPDIVMNPHAIPSRMTIGQLMECILGKSCAILGGYSDCTPFSKIPYDKICDILEENGFNYSGDEVLYSGVTGQQLDVKIFFGPTYYQRLKHMALDKIHSRSSGPVVQLTRQPAEGRSRDGGLRLGEMERDCIDGKTPISGAFGLSINIEDLDIDTFDVLGFDAVKNGLTPSKQSHFLDKGEKQCLDIYLEDGRKITCTPEHRLLDSGKNWINAKDLKINESRLKCSVNYPSIKIKDEIRDCNNWQLIVSDKLTLKTNNVKEYMKTLAFARILGYLSTDGNIGRDKRGYYNAKIYLGHQLDVNNLIRDLQLFSPITKNDFTYKNLFMVRLHPDLTNSIVKLPGVMIGNKVIQPSQLPAFILRDDCPLPVIREFLAGMFGGDGHTCNISKNTFTYISFSKSKRMEHLDSLKRMMEQIKGLFAKFDITGITLQNPKINSSSKNRANEDKNYEIVLHLDINELIPFYEKIGFRYCCHKNQRLEAAVSYMRLRSGVSRQKAWIINRVDQLTNYKAIKTANYETKVSTNKAVKQATEELTALEPLLHKCSIPSPHDILEYLINEREGGKFCSTKFPTSTEYLQSIGALGWFKDEPVRTTIPDEDSNEDVAEDAANEPAAAPTTTTTPTTQVTNTATCFGVNKDCEVLPTMDLKVIDIREGGTHKVYDIQVDQEESFLANGVVAHNCLISHGTMGFLKERLMDVSDIFTVHICKLCGLFSVVNPEEDGVRSCTGCDNYSEFMELRIPYACKLLMQELEGMMITPRFNVHHS